MLHPGNHGQKDNAAVHIERLVNTRVEQWWQLAAPRLANHARDNMDLFAFFSDIHMRTTEPPM